MREGTQLDLPVHALDLPALELTRLEERPGLPGARICLYVPARQEFLATLEMDAGIGAFWHYRHGERQKRVLCDLAASDGCVAAAVAEGRIVGYALLCPPGPLERWAQVPGMWEMSVEVSREWRQIGLAHRLLQVTFADAVWETRVVIEQGYSWHWDFDGTGLSVWDYAGMLRRLFERYGFAEFGTDDPEIRSAEGNILMARIGAACDRALRRAFYEDLYKGPHRPAWLDVLLAAT